MSPKLRQNNKFARHMATRDSQNSRLSSKFEHEHIEHIDTRNPLLSAEQKYS